MAESVEKGIPSGRDSMQTGAWHLQGTKEGQWPEQRGGEPGRAL